MFTWLKRVLGARGAPQAGGFWDPVVRGWPASFNGKTFWLDYFGVRKLAGRYEDLRELQLLLPVVENCALSLGFEPDLSTVELRLAHAGADWKLAWRDTASWHPDLFRWEELRVVCTSLARASPHCTHPGVPLLLLHQFTPVTDKDDLGLIRSELTEAIEVLGLFSDREIVNLIDRSVRERDDDVQWVGRAGSYRLVGSDVYSLRDPDDPSFPSHAFYDMLESAAQ